MESGEDPKVNETGSIINLRLQNMGSIQFSNGDYFIGIFKDGRPNGEGMMFYKQSIKSTSSGMEFEVA